MFSIFFVLFRGGFYGVSTEITPFFVEIFIIELFTVSAGNIGIEVCWKGALFSGLDEFVVT
jgi:hypothetical protein